MSFKYKVGDHLREVGTNPPITWEVIETNNMYNAYSLRCLNDGSELHLWSIPYVEDENKYKWVSASDDSTDAPIRGRIYLYKPEGIHVIFSVTENIDPYGECYSFIDYYTGEKISTPITCYTSEDWLLLEDATSSATTPSVPTTEGEALYQFFATPQGQWKGWSEP